MDRPTQTHCVRVAQTCLKLATQHKVNIELLVKAALLHDIGKPANVIKTFHRIIIVLTSTLVPKLSKHLINQHSDFQLYKAFHAHYCHPATGANIARMSKLPGEMVYLIENHHHKSRPNDSLELQLLQQADDLN
nr:HD domain-containing protein [Desulforamulus aquiferis]